jgi:hypothetical protein
MHFLGLIAVNYFLGYEYKILEVFRLVVVNLVFKLLMLRSLSRAGHSRVV